MAKNDIIEPQRDNYENHDTWYVAMDVYYELYHWNREIMQQIKQRLPSPVDEDKDYKAPSPAGSSQIPQDNEKQGLKHKKKKKKKKKGKKPRTPPLLVTIEAGYDVQGMVDIPITAELQDQDNNDNDNEEENALVKRLKL